MEVFMMSDIPHKQTIDQFLANCHISDIFSKVVSGVEKTGTKWNGSTYESIKDFEIDLRGKIGELLVERLLEDLGVKTESNDETDRTKKHWDIRDLTNGIDIEVKTATEGNKSKTFQFEGFEKSRDYHAVILLGIAPDEMFITCAPKKFLPFGEKDNRYTKNAKKMHRREHGIQYKWTLSRKDMEDRQINTLKDFKNHYETLIEEIRSNY